jgi:hypothetical protein
MTGEGEVRTEDEDGRRMSVCDGELGVGSRESMEQRSRI